MKTEIKMKTRS